MERYYQPEIETASREQITAWQSERLVRQVRHVWDNVPYYRKKMEEKGVTPEDIRSKKRSQQISNARKVAIYLVHDITQMTLAAIGEEFGNRDHSTIVYAVKYVVNNMKKDSDFRDAIESISKTIRDGSGK